MISFDAMKQLSNNHIKEKNYFQILMNQQQIRGKLSIPDLGQM
jgi:hypothetical protein